jgi:hypothetical protein
VGNSLGTYITWQWHVSFGSLCFLLTPQIITVPFLLCERAGVAACDLFQRTKKID